VSLPLMLSTGAFNRRQLWPHLCASDSEFNKKRERVFASRRSKIKEWGNPQHQHVAISWLV